MVRRAPPNRNRSRRLPLPWALVFGALISPTDHRPIGALVARLVALRAFSAQLMRAAERGEEFATDAALAKDAGGLLEQDMTEVVRMIGVPRDDLELEAMMNSALLSTPTVTLRGGSTEIVRGITARTLLRG